MKRLSAMSLWVQSSLMISPLSITTAKVLALAPPLNPAIQPLDVELSYSCTLPSSEVEPLKLHLRSEAPTQVNEYQPFKFQINADFEFGIAFTTALQESGASELMGSVETQLTVHTDFSDKPMVMSLTLASNSLSTDSTRFVAFASGLSETQHIAANEVALSAGENLNFVIQGVTSDGTPSLPPFDSLSMSCMLDPPSGQTLTANPGTLDFQSIFSGTNRQKYLLIRNGTPYAAYISEMTLDGESATAFDYRPYDYDYCSSLAPSQGCSLRLMYTASTPGTDNAVLNIKSNFGVTSVPITGKSVVDGEPDFEVSSTLIDFGKVAPGEKVVKELVITNLGPGLVSYNVPYIPEGSSGFRIPGYYPKVDVGESRKYSIVFQSTGNETEVSRATINVKAYHSASKIIPVTLVADARAAQTCDPIEWLANVEGDVTLGDSSIVTSVAGIFDSVEICPDSIIKGNLQLDASPVEIPFGDGVFSIIKTEVQLSFLASELATLRNQTTIESKIYLKLPVVTAKLFGLNIRLGGGADCRTSDPVSLTLSDSGLTPVGSSQLGVMNGTIQDIGQFENCGAATGWLNRNLATVDSN